MPGTWHLSCIIKNTSTVFCSENRHVGFPRGESNNCDLFHLTWCERALVKWVLVYQAVTGSLPSPSHSASHWFGGLFFFFFSFNAFQLTLNCHCFRHFQESSPPLPPPALSSSSVVCMLEALNFQVNFLTALHAAVPRCCGRNRSGEKTHSAKLDPSAICYVSVSDLSYRVKLLINE